MLLLLLQAALRGNDLFHPYTCLEDLRQNLVLGAKNGWNLGDVLWVQLLVLFLPVDSTTLEEKLSLWNEFGLKCGCRALCREG